MPFSCPLDSIDSLANNNDDSILIICTRLSICALHVSLYSLTFNPIALSNTTNRRMSPPGLEAVVLHRLQHHVTQPAEMATCCPLCWFSSSPLLDSVVVISSRAKNRITRTSSKNIMPVLDSGHLLAFPRDMLDAGGGWGEDEEGIFRPGLRGWREGEEMTWPHAPSVKRFYSVLASSPGPQVQVKPRAPTGRCPMLQATAVVICRSDQSASLVRLIQFGEGLRKVSGLILKR